MQENLHTERSKELHLQSKENLTRNLKSCEAMPSQSKASSKTLVLCCTYKITAGIMSEFQKMQNCGVEAVLAINNTYKAVDDDKSGAVQDKTLFGVEAKCLLLYQKDLENLGLLIEKNIGHSLWLNTDYWVYVARKYFDFDYIWTIDYDCFLNAKDYKEFFDFYKKERADLIVSHFRKENKDTKWQWCVNTNWAYDESVQWCGSLFALARYSKDLASLLYEKRLEYKEKFLAYKGKKQWLMCEFFTTTEAYKNGFLIKNFTEDGHQIRMAQFDLNTDRIFTQPNNKMYHPVKENLHGFLAKIDEPLSELIKENSEEDEKLALELCKTNIQAYLYYRVGFALMKRIRYSSNPLKFLARWGGEL